MVLRKYFLFAVVGDLLRPESILNIRYGISGQRTIGAHPPVPDKSTEPENAQQELIFKSVLVLQRPVLDPCLAVGFLPLPSDELKVGELVTMKWRVERLKGSEDNDIVEHNVSVDTKFYKRTSLNFLES